jgi:hypothetical protein
VGVEVGLDGAMVSRGIATADVDGDGRMDFSVSNMWGPSYYFKNESPSVGRFIGLRLVLPERGAGDAATLRVLPGRPPWRGRAAYGATASITLPCGRVLTREVDGGNGHTGRRSAELHFGLGQLEREATALPVTLRWRGADGRAGAPVQIRLKPDTWSTVVLGRTREARRASLSEHEHPSAGGGSSFRNREDEVSR